MTSAESISKVSSYALKHFPCLLCGASPKYGAAFIPDKPYEKRYGAKSGKGRALGYALCERCKALPDRDSRVEAILHFQVNRQKDKVGEIGVYSKDQQDKFLASLKEEKPCALCRSLTSTVRYRKLNAEEKKDFGIDGLVISVCDSCLEDPHVQCRLEEHLHKLRMAKRGKSGKVLSFKKKRKPTNKKPGKSRRKTHR